MKLLSFGLFIFTLVLGLLVGASNTPVVGAAVSGILGLAVAMSGLLFGKNAEASKTMATPGQMGSSLIILSAGILAGVYLGSQYRNYEPSPEAPSFVWTDAASQPQTTAEALDWIRVRRALASQGYTMQQIREVYAIRQRERGDSNNPDHQYSSTFPFYKMIESAGDAAPRKAANRGPASETLDE